MIDFLILIVIKSIAHCFVSFFSILTIKHSQSLFFYFTVSLSFKCTQTHSIHPPHPPLSLSFYLSVIWLGNHTQSFSSILIIEDFKLCEMNFHMVYFFCIIIILEIFPFLLLNQVEFFRSVHLLVFSLKEFYFLQPLF